jgi:uncharacterized coiled-coil protein SlyX
LGGYPAAWYFNLMNEELGQRLERLEANVAHLEHQVEQMNQVLIQQDKLVEFLKKQVKRQSDVLESMELERIKANQTKPPHYQ